MPLFLWPRPIRPQVGPLSRCPLFLPPMPCNPPPQHLGSCRRRPRACRTTQRSTGPPYSSVRHVATEPDPLHSSSQSWLSRPLETTPVATATPFSCATFFPLLTPARHPPSPLLHLVQCRRQRNAAMLKFGPEQCHHLPHSASHSPCASRPHFLVRTSTPPSPLAVGAGVHRCLPPELINTTENVTTVAAVAAPSWTPTFCELPPSGPCLAGSPSDAGAHVASPATPRRPDHRRR
jgi:hypothetical protein